MILAWLVTVAVLILVGFANEKARLDFWLAGGTLFTAGLLVVFVIRSS